MRYQRIGCARVHAVLTHSDNNRAANKKRKTTKNKKKYETAEGDRKEETAGRDRESEIEAHKHDAVRVGRRGREHSLIYRV